GSPLRAPVRRPWEPAGHQIWWEFNKTADLPSLPECEDCTVVGHSNIFATNPVMSVVLQEGVGRVTHLTATSGVSIAPPLIYMALDVYNNTVWNVGDNVETLAHVRTRDPSVDGDLIQPYLPGGSYFSNLIMAADAGTTHGLYFAASDGIYIDVRLDVTMNYCLPGEEYRNKSTLCVPCEPGSIKFDNTDAKCILCSEDGGLECKGGSHFEVMAGYWLPSSAVNTICRDDSGMVDTYCVLGKVYKCDTESACDSQGDRSNVGDVFTVTAEELCGEGYNADVALCGACKEEYQRNIDGDCVSCPDQGLRVVRSVVISALTLATMAALWVVAIRVSRSMQANRFRSAFRDENAGVIMTMISVLLGHLQVLGQQPVIYTKETFPDEYFNFLKFPSAFNLDVLSWMGYECGSSNETTPFVATFSFYSVMPLLGMFPTIYGLQAFARSRRREYVRRRQEALRTGPSMMRDATLKRDLSRGVSYFDQITETELVSSNPMFDASASQKVDPAEILRMASLEDQPQPFMSKETSQRVSISLAAQTGSESTDASWQVSAAGRQSTTPSDWPVQGLPGDLSEDELSDKSAEETAGPALTSFPSFFFKKKAVSQKPDGDDRKRKSSVDDRKRKSSVDDRKRKSSVDDRKRKSSVASVANRKRVSSNYSLGGVMKRFSTNNEFQEDGDEEDIDDVVLCERSWRSVYLMKLEVDAGSSAFDALNSFLSISVLFLILMHPTVSTYMFQVFNCDRIYFEAEEVRYFLALDRSLECYTQTW
ncbi:hypothetical protein CYMTET_33849, partial [Cymbomonas tetramitiformis]